MRYHPRTLGRFAVVLVELLLSLTNGLSARERGGATKSGAQLVGVFDMFNFPILSFGLIRISFLSDNRVSSGCMLLRVS